METVESLINTSPTYTYLFCGDYNLLGLSWLNESDGLTFSSNSSSSGSCVPETFASLNFFQHNSVLNSSQSTLDLIFSGNISVEKSLNHLAPCDSFHPALEISLLTIPHIPFVNNSHTFFDFRKSDYPKIISFLNSFDWSTTLLNLDANSAAYCLCDALHYSILNFVPEIRFTPSKFPPWFTN